MPDVAIANTVTSPVPEDYPLTGAQELLLKAVRARFDGTNAAQAFYPAVQLLSPNGVVMWTAIPKQATAAGGLADVSYFPGAD